MPKKKRTKKTTTKTGRVSVSKRVLVKAEQAIAALKRTVKTVTKRKTRKKTRRKAR